MTVSVPETLQAEMASDPAPAPAPPPKRHRYSWAHQLKRSLHVDALVCPKCARGPPTLLRVHAFLFPLGFDHPHRPAYDY
jgi:hypothetical protein